ncbi:PRD domain-containing protein [Clostridium sp. NSJ-49]|mgnify:CR=1 FL=1|uniref:BglG family transcription antiterminator LicT n=1 Tax=Clostridium TaxID=1485 RepID=UPI00164BCE60|nr:MULTISPECIES: PRD domain-containing protein [unclassified Clostridium]MBC5624336.1 PRD domain-containing protein [Clostridium sp. NSJ-49]MCD2501533.1 PRD domain-containing protein [Clostridium sp. NSJ-145]
MIIEKVLNNNVVVSIDPKTKKEIILLGSGIAFNKKIGQEVDESKIEKTFVLDDKTLGNKFKKLINQIPDGVFQLSHEIISHASKELNAKFDKQIYISLSDHIAFAIKRYKKNMMIKNELLNEIRRVHKKEYKVALWALEFLNRKLKIELPEDEAGFIALHFINASLNQSTSNSIESTKIVKDILNIIRYYFSLEFKEDDLNYDRLLTHLKYFSKRIIENNQDNASEDEFINMVIKSYPEAYNCTLKIKEYIVNNYKYDVNSNEIVYLTLHIQRIVSVSRYDN